MGQMTRPPTMAYPGAKNNLAPGMIIPMLDPRCTRFVDACAGRGSVSFAAMALCQYRRYWLNDTERWNFFRVLKEVDSTWFKKSGKDLPRRNQDYYLMRDMFQEPELTVRGEFPRHALRKYGASLLIRGAKNYAELVEVYLSHNGGTYNDSGPRGTLGRGGITPEGFVKSVLAAGALLRDNYARITKWHCFRVLAQCGRESMVYL
jgi:hypothetical protein